MVSKRNTAILLALLIVLISGAMFVLVIKIIGTFDISIYTAIIVVVVPILAFIGIVVLWGYRSSRNDAADVSRHS